MPTINLIEGKDYIIDERFQNGGKVKLVKLYGKLFCRVKDLETNYEWDTSCYRLSEVNNL